MQTQVETFATLIRQKLPTYGSPEAAAIAVSADFEGLGFGFTPEMKKSLAAATILVEKSLQGIEILRRISIVKPKDNWYTGPGALDQHWPALEGYLENVKRWDNESVSSIAESSAEVVSLLANPAKNQFRCRGLVVGYVQSGKTANMTAVIARAVDAGYNLIVLLGGVTNKLRAQTQRRIESDICSRHRQLWQLYTTPTDRGDFTAPPNRSFTMPVAGRAQLAVMKKEGSRLDSFLKTVDSTPPAILGALKTLIIDDECDQASVNAAKGDFDMTSTNEKIRKIIRALPAVTYVGYTATPFANVFINPFPHNKDSLDDLYPEDFIAALPRPKDYFGAREVFGFEPDNAEDEGGEAAGRDMLRVIPAAEVALIRPATAKAVAAFRPTVTVELEKAISWFLISSAIRRRRGQAALHMTMLVHTSPNIVQHTRMADAIRSWIGDNSREIADGEGDAWNRMQLVWVEETARSPLTGSGEAGLHLEDVRPELKDVLAALEVAVENGVSDQRMDFTSDAKTYIVVGGSVLARGLTLEGLSVSFFLRTSQQYDTLLQMGRWFGFRHGYADLPRLWTTSDLISNFRSLANVEEEIREEIAVYRVGNATPLDFAVKVREIPGMAITSAAKMKHAHRTSISFEGRHIQTIRFEHRSTSIVQSNWSAASRLLAAAVASGTRHGDEMLVRAVPLSHIRKFLVEYNISERHLDLKRDLLLAYLDKVADGLPIWNVGIVAPNKGPVSEQPLGPLGPVTMNKRARLAGEDSYADIKALMSKADILVDALSRTTVGENEGWRELKALRPSVPLLLLYPIDRLSEPRSQKQDADGRPTRVALDAVGDLLGIGIVFPGSVDHSGGYYSVELDVPTPEQLADEESEELLT